MNATDATLQQISRVINKIHDKFPSTEEAMLMTDMHLRVNQDTGEFLVFDDDDNEITRVVVEQWISNKDSDFYEEITHILRREFDVHKKVAESMSIIKPYSFVLENEEKEQMAEIFVVDDDTIIIDSNMMPDLDEELNAFLNKLLSE